MRTILAIVLAVLLVPQCWAQGAQRMQSETGPKTVIGPTNPALQDGADALLAGRAEDGVRLTLQGLKVAGSAREEEAALSNLCAGYILLEKFGEAMRYCDLLLARNDENWRAYNNRAVIYIQTQQYDKAERDLERGEALRPGAHTLKVARAMYMDAVHPVSPEVIVDDRDASDGTDDEDADQ
ncbi:MAG: tetratricopeptide repeat protein [Woeseiaceae bacterium]|nr:tetratricopeptide repeat protein [Woeseiaceae bacterium]